MRKHTTTNAAEQDAPSPALAAEIDTIESRLTIAMRGLAVGWDQDEMLAAEEALQAVKVAIVETMLRHYAPPQIAAAWHEGDRESLPTGFPLCPILQRDSVQADLSNGWRVIDLSIDQLRGEWDSRELRNCAAMLFGALGLLKVAKHRIAPADATSAPHSPAAPESGLFAAASARREEADRLSRASALDAMREARPTPEPSLRGLEFQRLTVELEQASSLLTDASCSMSGGWTMNELERCDAMVSGAKALIDQGRARLEHAEAHYVRALQPEHDDDHDHDQAGEEVQPEGGRR